MASLTKEAGFSLWMSIAAFGIAVATLFYTITIITNFTEEITINDPRAPKIVCTHDTVLQPDGSCTSQEK